MRWVTFVRGAAAVLCMGACCIGCADENWPDADASKPRLDAGPDVGAPTGGGSVDSGDEPGNDRPDVSIDGGPDAPGGTDGTVATADAPTADALMPVDAGDGSRPFSVNCRPVQSAEPIPARSVATSSDAGAGDETIFVGTDLFGRFDNACGSCHVASDFGALKVSVLDFKPGSTKVGPDMLARMLSDDPLQVMPPVKSGGAVNSQRKPGDPVIKLSQLFQQWIDAGQPADVFKVPRVALPAGAAGSYLMPPERGGALTNIGDCVPNDEMVGAGPAVTRAQQLDTFFAGLTKALPGSGASVPERIGLPERLDQTDLFTLDTSTLAQHRVIAYAPTYPLWSDSARKLRHVRVPMGQSIRFDKATQTFDIPANTRFYKTFLKPVVEKGGNLRYRKIETRLIVSRPDVDAPDGTTKQMALFGTYKWDDAEQSAILVTETLNNAEPFKDQLLTLVMDEDKAEQIRANTPPTQDLAKALEAAHVTRKYAIPGSDRCVQCHMGSATKNFVLGFFPLQVKHRPAGQGGVIEAVGPDELNQLERLISYGIITGINAVSDVMPLEASQGDRKPRNEQELDAQGYVIGNCSHCHNARGFPSVENIVLKDVLNFLPSSAPSEPSATPGCKKQGGIFQFPLECMSPRIARGVSLDVPIPYITPSLVDFPTADGSNYLPKGQSSNGMDDAVAADLYMVLAPWRSLIYRNVDTPFTYGDGGAIFPHMPMNTPGFDCRAPRILGDWMVSIPATRLQPNIREDLIPGVITNKGADLSPQPYREVLPSEAGYAKAAQDARDRLTKYHDGTKPKPTSLQFSRYLYCPDNSNIQDPWVTLQDALHLSPPAEDTFKDQELIMPNLSTPRRAHWVVTDQTLPKIDGWNPKRNDWDKVLVHRCMCNETKPECKNSDNTINRAYRCNNTDGDLAAKLNVKRVVGILNPEDPAVPGVRWSDELKSYALTPIPFGIWQERAGCNYSGQRTVASYRQGSQRPPYTKWMDDPAAPPDAAHVYNIAPGNAVFNMICINCHGANADSRGRMADTLLTMTGGSARVANLRDGLFGSNGAYRSAVFGAAADATTTADDWAVRYVAWMALGGTTKVLPPAVLAVVGNTQVLGIKRPVGPPGTGDANMLSVAKGLCALTLPNGALKIAFDPITSSFDYAHSSVTTALITNNGDLEFWQHLCPMGHRAPVRALGLDVDNGSVHGLIASSIFLRPETYPAGAPVGNDTGGIELADDKGVRSGNLLPWCWSTSPQYQAMGRQWAHEHAINGQDLPECPADYRETEEMSEVEVTAWTERGAMNAGLAVFTYLNALTKGDIQRPPAHNECPK